MSTTARAAGAAAILFSLAVLSGCVAGPATAGGESGPDAFRERAELPSCGSVILGQGEEIPADAAACLADAGADGAELALTRPTVEGDPVTEYYRVLPSGGWEIYVDMTRDAFGGGWWFNECPDAASIADLGQCTSTEL